jgi:hypothetical protein
MKVRASPEASRYIRQRGGKLFMWFQPARGGGSLGFLKISTGEPSRQGLDFDHIGASGFELVYDRALARPKELRVELRRFPWSRLQVTGIGGTAGAEAGPGPEDHWWLDRGGGGGGNGGGGNDGG